MAAKYMVILCLISASAISINAISQAIGANRVLPGQNANIGIFPFIASISLFPADTFLCAGAVIGDTWILTSAECIYNYTAAAPNPVRVRVGGVQITVDEPGEQLISAFRLVAHNNFRPPAAAGSNARLDQDYYNNIGLIELISSISWSSGQVAFAALAEPTEIIAPGDTVVLAGWGGISETTPVDNLQYSTNLHIMTNQDCYNAVPGTQFDQYHICTAPYPDTTACKYDHGGPLFKFDSTRGTVILGVVNYAPCWDSTHPTVFASVPAHRNWIFATSGI